jgi:hypothetical protein
MRCWFGEQHPGTVGPEDWQVHISVSKKIRKIE